MFKDKFQSLENSFHPLINELIGEIEKLEQNPKIKELSKNSFVMSSKDLKDNWTPFFHNHKTQYETIIAIIKNTPTSEILKRLENIVKNGYCKYCEEKFNFNPIVIEKIKSLL